MTQIKFIAHLHQTIQMFPFFHQVVKECSENNMLMFIDRPKKLRSCRDVACYVSTVHLPQNEQYQ
jgi:hypothetical protein